MGRIYTFDQALEIVSQLVKQLHRAHLRERSDFDITPTSVIVEMDGEGRPVVRLREVEFEDGRPPESLDTWRYRAPERWWGARKSSVTDQYALAALFVELVTGKAPFAGLFATNDFNVVKTVLANRPADLAADCPRRDVLLRALAKDPRSRYPTCSAFAAELADPSAATTEVGHGHHHHHHHHHHGEGAGHSANGRPRRKGGKGKWFFVLLLLGGGLFWAWQTGNLDRWLDKLNGLDLDGKQAKQQAEARKQAAEKAEKAKREHAAKLAEIREAVQRQTAVVDQARKELQDFLKTGDASYLGVRLEAQKQQRQKLAESLAASEREAEAARSLEQALVSFSRLGMSGAGVAKEIPGDSELIAAYKALVEEAQKVRELRAKFTEKHPSVIAQAKLYEAAAARFKAAMEGALSQAKAVREQKEATLAKLAEQTAKATAECEKLEHELEMAQAKKVALEGREKRETDHLVELRRKELEIEFGEHKEISNNEKE